MIEHVDVTKQVSFCDNDGECLPITKCVCGNTFAPWDRIIDIYPEYASECPHCKAKLFFRQSITVYQVCEVPE